MKSLPSLLVTAAFVVVAASMWLPDRAGAQAVATGDATRGRAAVMKFGCYECHGTQGQGNYFSGPAIAPHPIDYKNFLAYVRAPRREMPPYSADILPDTTAADIYAYLASIPVGKAAADIPQLRDTTIGNTGAAPVVAENIAHGRTVYVTSCIKCHTFAPIGPSLVNLKARMDLDKTTAFIKNPAPPMTKLYPGTLSDKDVADVAAYVQSL